MDFDAAITAHTRWKYRLMDYVDGTSKEQLDPKVVACDNCCDLGKWIHAANPLAGHATFAELKAAHAAFHKSAAEIVVLAQAGKRPEARALLAATAPYTAHSASVVLLIKQLKTVAPQKVAA